MRLIALALISACLSPLASADNETAAGPRTVIDTLFHGMRTGNGDLVRHAVGEGALLERVEADGSVKASSFEDWAVWVDTQSPGDSDEQIFAVKTHQSGNLASVWAPFILMYKGELVGCGINQFILARTGGQWRIIRGVDTQDGGDCATFKDRYVSSVE